MSSKHSSNLGLISKKALFFCIMTVIASLGFFSILVPNACAWTEDPILTTDTFVREPHVTELRDSINTLRVNKGLPPINWTDDPLVAGTTPVREVHFTEMQTALLELYEGPWDTIEPTFSTLDTTDPISLTDLQDLRVSTETVGWVGDGICQNPPEHCSNSIDCQATPCPNTWTLMTGYACGADCPDGTTCGPGERCYSRMCGSPTACQVWYACQRNTNEATYCNCDGGTCSMYENSTECFNDCGCGNGMLNAGEVCDGDTVACTTGNGYGGTQACNGSCSGYGTCNTSEYCGDGFCNGGETCSNCQGDCGVCASCGDGNIGTGEQCDGTDLGGEDCVSLGLPGGTLSCDNCAFDTSACNMCAPVSCGSYNLADWPCQCDGGCLGAGDCCANGPC